MIYRFIEMQRPFHSVEMMAGVLGVSRGGYYAWRRRPTSRRTMANTALAKRIRKIQKKARWRYGSPRVTDELRRQGITVSEKRVARIMRALELGRRRRRKFRVTTKSAHRHEPAPNLLQRNFTAAEPNRVWVSDLSYIATAEGWLYLCVILDLYSRRVVGWSMSTSLATDMVVRAFLMAVLGRTPPAGLIFHSDRGVQYASTQFRSQLRSHRMQQSMSRKGDCWDNACAESFFSTLKEELIGDTIFRSRDEAKRAIFEYIEVFYNRERLHSYIGNVPPVEFEEESATQIA